MTTISIPDARANIEAFSAGLTASFFERKDVVRGLIVSLVAGEHVLLLGPPGTAKSALASATADATGWQLFERLLGMQSVPEELFGPYDLSGLGASPSRFERCIGGYMPTAEVAFVDEIFKANTAILNSLLTLLNERKFDQGSKRISCPLEICIGASNEYPQDDKLSALYDRFLTRFWVDYIRSESEFGAMLLSSPAALPTLEPGAIFALRAAAQKVDISDIVPLILAVKATLAQDHGVIASDRRWKSSLKLVRASAALAGRTKAKGIDLLPLVDCLWNKAEERDIIRTVVAKTRSPALAAAEKFLDLAKAEAAKMPNLNPTAGKLSDASGIGAAGNVLDAVRKIVTEASRLLDRTEPDEEVSAMVDEIVKIGDDVWAAIGRATQVSPRPKR